MMESTTMRCARHMDFICRALCLPRLALYFALRCRYPPDSAMTHQAAFDSDSAFREVDAALQTLPRVRALLAKLHRASPESKKICPRG